jgi:hypothetical protein
MGRLGVTPDQIVVRFNLILTCRVAIAAHTSVLQLKRHASDMAPTVTQGCCYLCTCLVDSLQLLIKIYCLQHGPLRAHDAHMHTEHVC